MESETFFFALLVCPDHGQLIARPAAELVDHIKSVVEIFGNRYGERVTESEIGIFFCRTFFFHGGTLKIYIYKSL